MREIPKGLEQLNEGDKVWVNQGVAEFEFHRIFVDKSDSQIVEVFDLTGRHAYRLPAGVVKTEKPITLTLDRKQADQLLLCIEAGLCWAQNFKEMFKHFGRAMFHKKDLWFMRAFRVRPVKSIKKQIQEKLK